MKYETKQSQSVYGYSNKTNTAITIYLSQPRLIPVMRSLLEETGISYKGIFKKYPTFETNFLFVLRFMTDVKMTGFSWIKIKNGSFAESTRKISSCQYEIDVK